MRFKLRVVCSNQSNIRKVLSAFNDLQNALALVISFFGFVVHLELNPVAKVAGSELDSSLEIATVVFSTADASEYEVSLAPIPHFKMLLHDQKYTCREKEDKEVQE